MTKPIISPIVKRLCKGYVAELCPPSPPVPCPVCPIPPVPDPQVVRRPPISSTFNIYWMDYMDGDKERFLMTNMALQRSIGVETVFIMYGNGVFLSTFVKAAREYGMKVVLPTVSPPKEIDGWLDAVKKGIPEMVELDPDGWYVNREISLGWPHYRADLFPPVINFLHGLKPVPVWISPFYGPGGPFSPIEADELNWEVFVRSVTEKLTPGVQMRSALQDGVGCDNVPDRIPGSDTYRELQKRFKLHKTICERYGWKASINCELMGYDRSPATPERIKAQLLESNSPDYVSKGLGIGPCFDASFITYQMKDLSYLYPSATYRMLWNLYNRE